MGPSVKFVSRITGSFPKKIMGQFFFGKRPNRRVVWQKTTLFSFFWRPSLNITSLFFITIQGIQTETFNEYIKSQSFGFWGTHTIDAMKKDAVKKRRKHKRSKEQNPQLLPHKTIPNQPYSPSGS